MIEITQEHIDKVGLMARIHLKHAQRATTIDDLTHAGMVGLLVARNDWDASKGASFKTYAHIKIRGALLDYFRSCDNMPKDKRRMHGRIRRERSRLEQVLLREPTHREVYTSLGISSKKYYGIMSADIWFDLQFDDIERPSHATPDVEQERRDAIRLFMEAPKQHRRDLYDYYIKEINLVDMGKARGYSESGACRCKNRAARAIAAQM